MSDNYKDQVLSYAKEQRRQYLKNKGVVLDDEVFTYVIYARKSTKGTRDKGGRRVEKQERSIKDQIKDCQALANKKNLNVVKIFEESESAKVSGKRDVFYEMMDGIKSGDFDSIITWHPNRLARNMKDAGEIIDLLDRGVIKDLKFPQYLFIKDSNGLMTLGINFIMAKKYSDNVSEQVSRGNQNLVDEGKIPNNKPIHGYKIERKKLRPDGNDFNLMKEAFQLALKGDPLSSIANHLNESGFKYEGKKCPMTKQKLSRDFQNPTYAGILLYGGEFCDLSTVDPSFTPLIDYKDFVQLRTIMNQSTSYKKTRAKTILLRKMVICGHCNNLMTPAKSTGGSKNRYLRLKCSNQDCERNNSDSLTSGFRAKIIFDFIYKLLDDITVKRPAYKTFMKASEGSLNQQKNNLINKIRIINKNLTELDNDLSDYKKSLGKAEGRSIDELNETISNLRQEIRQLKARREKLQSNLTKVELLKDHRVMSFEEFTNFFNNIAERLKTTDNRYLADKIIRMIFTNFTVKGKKVTTCQLNPHFEELAKKGYVLKGGRAWTRTRDLTNVNRAL